MYNPKLTTEQREFVLKSIEYGKAAHQKGYTAPYLDMEFMGYLNSVTDGWKMSHVRTAMYKGWHRGKVEATLGS